MHIIENCMNKNLTLSRPKFEYFDDFFYEAFGFTFGFSHGKSIKKLLDQKILNLMYVILFFLFEFYGQFNFEILNTRRIYPLAAKTAC